MATLDAGSAPVVGGQRIGRIPIRDLTPAQPEERWPAKASVGEVVPFEATVFREGHGALGAELELTGPDGVARRHRMRLLGPGTDRWQARVMLDTPGLWSWRVHAWSDEWASWRHTAEAKAAAGQDLELVFAAGAELLAGRSARAYTDARRRLLDAALSPQERLAAASEPRLLRLLAQKPVSRLESASEAKPLRVERHRAAVGAWYEFFPRSEGAKRGRDGSWTSGTFRSAAKRLPAIARMGFEVVYLPPIHPIGVAFRKGPNNSTEAGPHDPGSPWAIGGPMGDGTMGGHDAIHPDLGTERDFAYFLRKAGELGLEVALDLALQCSPDHPWVTEHPEWFTHRPDGSIAYAENPPKKYQDIYPLDFDTDPAGLSAEILRIVELWIARGVRIFRVDNPHTKPLTFWEWLIGEVNARHPDVVFLAEAFTRPAMMRSLAGAGFQQSYSYFTWRNTKEELEEFLMTISGRDADYLRPNLFVNTPDILTEYLQFGGPGAFKIRAAIAATAAPLWGVYSGYELYESIARPGSEENIDNEKYEFTPRDWARADAVGRSLAPYLTRLNEIRAAHPALGQLRGLRLHWSDDDAVLVFSKRLEAEFTGSGHDDTLIVVANVDPHSVRETLVHLDLEALGLPAPAGGVATGTEEPHFTAEDLITGARWDWGRDNYVRLDAYDEPVHILVVDRGGRGVMAARGSELDPRLIEELAHGRYAWPHDLLGPHPTPAGLVIRAVRPLARAVEAVWSDGHRLPLAHVAYGLWEGLLENGQLGPYELVTSYEDGKTWRSDDPYRFTPSVGEIDLHLWGEGRHEQLWHWLGAHVKDHESVAGTGFAVWAPNAHAARVVGDFNAWDGRQHAMRRLSEVGVWELFVPGLGPGGAYKFELLTDRGWVTRADPMARYTEQPPATASIIGHSQYSWGDSA